MAWEWSHTMEAYHTVEQRLQEMADLADAANLLCICWSEWVASDWHQHNESTELELRKYESALARAKRQAAEHGYGKLAKNIWNWSEELRTCTNGGWEA